MVDTRVAISQEQKEPDMRKISSLYAVAAPLVLISGLVATAPATAGNGTALTLINGWKNYSPSTPKPTAYLVNGIVHLKGAIKTSGSSDHAFDLPPSFAPSATSYVKVSLCNGSDGRIEIGAGGSVFVEPKNGNWAAAQCLTSLDGASFAVASDSFKPLRLRHQWVPYGADTREPMIRIIGGVVHFQGAMGTTGASHYPFVLPAKYHPAAEVFLPVDLCSASDGQILITPDGTAAVQAETDFSNAQCFTSLEGVEFAVDSTGFTKLNLLNGWTTHLGSTDPGARLLNGGIVQLEGAMSAGSSAKLFVLPASFRPQKELRVPVNLCGPTNGQLQIQSDGTATLIAEVDFADAQCVTSLDGVSYHL